MCKERLSPGRKVSLGRFRKGQVGADVKPPGKAHLVPMEHLLIRSTRAHLKARFGKRTDSSLPFSDLTQIKPKRLHD